MRHKILAVFAGLGLLGIAAEELRAESVTFHFSGHIIHAEGTEGFPGGEVEGNIVVGYMTYDTATAPDTDPSEDSGFYQFPNNATNAIAAHIGNNRFVSSSGTFNVITLDSFPGSFDRFRASADLSPIEVASGGGSIFLEANSGDEDFMPSDDLPTTPFNLPTQGELLIGINGIGEGGVPFQIIAMLDSMTLPQPITFDFTATVQRSEGTESLVGGEVLVGSTLSGSLTYDLGAFDYSNLGEHFGFYPTLPASYSRLYGINILTGDNLFGNFFGTDPLHGDFSIFTTDLVPSDPSSGSIDQFFVRSVGNQFPQGTPSDSETLINLEIQSFDDFLASDALPMTPPPLQPDSRILINAQSSSSPVFLLIIADLDSLTISPTVVEHSLDNLKDMIAGLPAGSFKGANTQNALGEKIDATLDQLALIKAETDPAVKDQLIADLSDKVTNDILAKTNGCGSAPDKNDWIKDCPTQIQFQTQIQALLVLIDAL